MKRICITVLVALSTCLVVTAYAQGRHHRFREPQRTNDWTAPVTTNSQQQSIVIHVRVVPALDDSGSNSVPWHVQAGLYQTPNGGGEYVCVNSRTSLADNSGQLTFYLPVQETHTALMTYRVTCLGRWAYSDASSIYLTASHAGEYNITLTMQRK